MCWGMNDVGQLGDNSTTSSSTPVEVTGLSSGITSIYGGYPEGETCARSAGGVVKCWGENGRGQLGNNSTTGSTVPVDVLGFP